MRALFEQRKNLPPQAQSTPGWRWAPPIAIFLIGSVIFWAVAYYHGADIKVHARYLISCIEQRFLPAAFGYYVVLAAVTLFSTNLQILLIGSGVVLGAALAVRYYITFVALRKYTSQPSSPEHYRCWVLPACSLGLIILFCPPMPNEYWMGSNFPPNLWHNSTYVFLMPFALLLFMRSQDYLEGGNERVLAGISLLVVINLLIKPSFFFCFAPIFPLFALTNFGMSRRFWLALTPVLIGVIVLGVQYLIIYKSDAYDLLADAGGASISLGWFYPWSYYAENIPLVLLNSLLLPLSFLAFYPHIFVRNPRVLYAAALTVVGVAIYAFVYETGPRALHGNFGWQANASNALLHLTIIASFLEIKRSNSSFNWRDWILVSLFVMEVAFGVAYLTKFLVSGNYM